MNRKLLKTAALALVCVMLCAVMAGCNNADTEKLPTETENPAVSGADTDTTVTKADGEVVDIPPVAQAPENPKEEVAEDCVFLGSWTVEAETMAVDSMTFSQDGSMELTVNGSLRGGTFIVEDTQISLYSGDKDPVVGTYVVDGDTITITTDSDVIVLTKA